MRPTARTVATSTCSTRHARPDSQSAAAGLPVAAARPRRALIDGGLPFDVRYGYEQGSQLAEALSFLRAHPGEIAFVTIDIGANDLRNGNGGLLAIAANLREILSALRAAGQACRSWG